MALQLFEDPLADHPPVRVPTGGGGNSQSDALQGPFDYGRELCSFAVCQL